MHKTQIHILLVDDSPSDANLLRQMFLRSGKEGWQLEHVERLGDAIDACLTRTCDVVLLDLSLPDSDGLDTLAEFRAAVPNVAIVVLTGVDDQELALQAVAKGAQDYLVKGQISTQLLVRAIRYAIERQLAAAQIKRALEQERELNKLKSNFITTTSHEFRTPLTTILFSAGFLQNYDEKCTKEKRQTHLHRIQTAVDHMNQMLDDVLLIGKADASNLEFNPAPLDLESTIREIVAEMQLHTGSKHTLTFFSPGESPPACMDEQLLRHILNNLLSNAIKYSPQGSTVLCELTFDLGAPVGVSEALPKAIACAARIGQSTIGEAILRIKDEGIGIPPEDQKRLFETFYRATNVGTIPGTGLGLNIVKKCVDLHKGEITVESQVGVGTTFTVKLPLIA